MTNLNPTTTFGVTERGDAGIDLRWTDAAGKIDAAVLITKHITPQFIENVMPFKHKIIVHCTCTGMGGSVMEPGVPAPVSQLKMLRCLIRNGFPEKQVVLRIDPVFPTAKGFRIAKAVADYATELIPELSRIRFSIMDLHYKNLQRRFMETINPKTGNSLYHDAVAAGVSFTASERNMPDSIKKLAIETFLPFAEKGISIETCGEPLLQHPLFVRRGCVSNFDADILGLPHVQGRTGMQRQGVCCCVPKTELLCRKTQCPHQCAYCFWPADYNPDTYWN